MKGLILLTLIFTLNTNLLISNNSDLTPGELIICLFPLSLPL